MDAESSVNEEESLASSDESGAVDHPENDPVLCDATARCAMGEAGRDKPRGEDGNFTRMSRRRIRRAARGQADRARRQEQAGGGTGDQASQRLRQLRAEAQAEAGDAHDSAEESRNVKGRQCRVHATPGQPTAKEIEQHRDEQHVEYRPWCPECVRARGTGEQHRSRPDEREVPIFSLDDMIFEREGVRG